MSFQHQEINEFSVNFSNNQENEAFRDNYVEFFGITRVRKGTSINEDIELSESIINDAVAMDAGFDSSDLPDYSLGQKNIFGQVLRPRNSEKYVNFHTIDWLKDLLKDKFRHRWLNNQKEKGNWLDKVEAWYDAFSGWFLVLLIGLGSGIVAGIVDIGSGWASNLKSGFCKPRFWLNREQCCWDSVLMTFDKFRNPECEEWVFWSNEFGINDKTQGYFISIIIYIFTSVCFGTIAAAFVKVFAPYASGSGVPEIKTILSGFVIKGYLGKWTLLIKSIGVILSSSAGLALGKEGPFVHVASCCGNIFSWMFPKYGRNEAKKREILSAAASAGVAVAFGAPIGGVLFSLEEVSYYFPLKTLWRSFFCAMVAAFVVRTINPFEKGHDVLFYIEYKPEWSFFELIPFVILGFLGGAFGYFFIKLNIKWCKFRKNKNIGKYPITEVILVTFLTASLGYLNEYTRMPMPELIRHLIGKCSIADDSILCDYLKNTTSANEDVVPLRQNEGVYEAIWKLFLALGFYMIMLVLTFGLKIPCGLFVPCLTIGAIAGRLLGIAMEIISFNFPDFFIFAAGCNENVTCVIPGVYAIVGACAFLGGATRMTVSLVVIMVELTSGLSLIVPLMVSAFSAKIFGDLFCSFGIYDAHIELNNYPFLDTKEDYKINAYASDVMKPQKNDPPLTVLIQDGMTAAEVEKIARKSKFVGFPIVVSKESQLLVGYILRRDLCMALDLYQQSGFFTPNKMVKFSQTLTNRKNETCIRLEKLVEYAPLCVSHQTSMDVVIDLFKKIGVSNLLVTHFGKIIGVITKKDILKHLEMKKR